MTSLKNRIIVYLFCAMLLAGAGTSATAQEAAKATELGPNLLLFTTSSGNVVASVGSDGVFLVGTPSAASTSEISRIVSSRTRSPLRYVVIAAQDSAHSNGDAGWASRGAFVAMQEKALERLGGHVMGPARPLPPRLVELRVDRPRIAFSEVLTFDMNGEAIHVVHQPAAYSNADFLVHFHAANLLYFGEVFPGDGYPDVDADQGGSLDGFVRTLSPWTDNKRRIVPARGNIGTGEDVKAFRDMIVSVRDRVQAMIADHRTEQDVVSAHPTADFDSRWGQGRVTADQFVRTVYHALTPTKP